MSTFGCWEITRIIGPAAKLIKHPSPSLNVRFRPKAVIRQLCSLVEKKRNDEGA